MYSITPAARWRSSPLEKTAQRSKNLRLSQEAAAALRNASAQSGRSQQHLLREAVDRFLGLNEAASTRDRAVAAGLVKPPSPFRDIVPFVKLRRGMTSVDLLDRDNDR